MAAAAWRFKVNEFISAENFFSYIIKSLQQSEHNKLCLFINNLEIKNKAGKGTAIYMLLHK